MDVDSVQTVAADTPGLAASAAAIGGLVAAVSACGGGGDETLPPAFYRTAEAENRANILAAAATGSEGGRMPTATELFDWAERAYPQFFPDHRPDLVSAPYVYRYYPASGNYVGLAGTDVYVLGPISGGELARVGALADFAALVLATQVAFTDEAAARFLQQAQFSSTLTEIAAVRAAGYEAWLQAQFNGPVSETGWDWMHRKGYTEVDHNELWSCQDWVTDYMLWQQLWSAPDAMRKRMALALSEFFVINVGGINSNWCHLVGATFWDILCRQAFGNFRQLLEDVSLSVAMGIFLNIDGSAKEDATGRQPDENYAREVMQLFTIGLQKLNLDGTPQRDGGGAPLSAFTQEDVRNLARVFTGYQRDYSAGFIQLTLPPPRNIRVPKVDYTRRPMTLNPDAHSMLAKNFLGVSIPANTAAGPSLKIALDTLFNHSNVGPFFGRQMIQRLVTSNPSPAYVARVAAAFNNNGQGVRGDMKAVWRAVLLDDEARSPTGLSDPTFGKLREPMVRIMQWGRTFGITSKYGYWKMKNDPGDPYQQLQQWPLRPSSVFGFFRPGYVPPGTAMAASKATAPEFQIVNESTICSWINHLCTFLLAAGIYVSDPDRNGSGGLVDLGPTAAAGIDMSVDYNAAMDLIPDWGGLVNRLNLLMCAGQLSAPTCQLISDALSRLWPGVSDQSFGERWMVGYALLYVMSAPEYIVQK